MSTTVPPAMDTDKSRIASVFPFPFCVPSSSPSTVFPPMPMFSAGLQQMYANFFHNQLLQMTQQQSPSLAPDVSPSISERTSSRGESPAIKKLSVDDTGNPLCPLCGDRLPDAEWSSHVEMEKAKLLGFIHDLRGAKNCEPSTATDLPRKKREQELQRIRSNQMKRMALKRSVVSIRDSLTPFSRQSNEDSGSSTFLDIKKEDDANYVKCAVCSRICDFGIVCSPMDSPRCADCFDMRRTNSLPLDQSSSSSPPEKKPRLEVN